MMKKYMKKNLSWQKCINVTKANLQGPKVGLWTSMWILDIKKDVSLKQYLHLNIAEISIYQKNVNQVSQKVCLNLSNHVHFNIQE